MTKRLPISPKIILILLVVVIVLGGIVYMRGRNSKSASNKTGGSQAVSANYINFGGNYVFKVPKDHVVDEQSVPNAQLVYTGNIEAKTLEDVYRNNGIAVQEISTLTDHTSNAFKKYVNETYVPDLKKNLSPSDVQTNFGKANGADNAKVIAKKDGKIIRYVYIKGGQHPAQVVANAETDAVKEIIQTIVDVESSIFKNEVTSLKQTVEKIAYQVKDKKTQELYSSAAPELREKSTQEELSQALDTATPYRSGSITISGGSSAASDEFASVIRFVKLDKKDQQPAVGSLVLKKIDGQWKLTLLSLPSPSNNQ